MIETLAEKTCTPCRGGVPPLTREEALRLQSQALDWALRDDDRRIERTFRFRNFREALAFVQSGGKTVDRRHARQVAA
jgi:4a-hydroxytetrahydrobiopterin dehydratase